VQQNDMDSEEEYDVLGFLKAFLMGINAKTIENYSLFVLNENVILSSIIQNSDQKYCDVLCLSFPPPEVDWQNEFLEPPIPPTEVEDDLFLVEMSDSDDSDSDESESSADGAKKKEANARPKPAHALGATRAESTATGTCAGFAMTPSTWLRRKNRQTMRWPLWRALSRLWRRRRRRSLQLHRRQPQLP